MKNVDGLLQKGMAALQSGRLRDAERCFRQAVEIAPRHFGALNLLTVALTGLERFDEAETIAERALRIDASSDATHYNYGTVLKHNNKLEQAIAAFDAALAINPRHVKALNNRGAVHSQLERYDEAIADFDRALALDRRYADAYYNKANALVELKRREEALRNFELALSLNPRHAGAYANLLILFSALGEYNKAVECGRRSLALESNSADVLPISPAPRWGGRSARRRCAGSAICWRNRPTTSWRSACASGFSFCSVSSTRRASTSNGSRRTTPRDAKEGDQKEEAIATLLFAEGRYEEGMAALDRAIAWEGPNQDHLRAARAGTMETFGRQDEARAAFDEALAFNPESSTAMCGRAELVKFTADDPMIAAMEALLAPEKGEDLRVPRAAAFRARQGLPRSRQLAGGVPSFQRGQPHEACGGVLQRRRD